MFKYIFIIIVCLFITFLQALVHWCAYESCFVVLVQASTISLAWVSIRSWLSKLFNETNNNEFSLITTSSYNFEWASLIAILIIPLVRGSLEALETVCAEWKCNLFIRK